MEIGEGGLVGKRAAPMRRRPYVSVSRAYSEHPEKQKQNDD